MFYKGGIGFLDWDTLGVGIGFGLRWMGGFGFWDGIRGGLGLWLVVLA